MKKTRSFFLALVLLLPAFISLVVLASSTASVDNTDRISAAIVNLDKPVTLDSGTTLPAGRQLVANLTSTDSSLPMKLDWEVVSESTAASGIESGTYEAVVTIPATFSSDVAAILQGNATTPPQVSVETKGSSLVSGHISVALTAAATDKLGTFLTVNYLSASLNGMNTLASGISTASQGASQLVSGQAQAADGAAQLNDGTSQLSKGAATLSDGLDTLSSGSNQLASGASQLNSGVRTYTQGVASASAGATRLSEGSSQLSSGVQQYTSGVSSIHAAMTSPVDGSSTSLVNGAAQVSSGLDQLNAAVQRIDVSHMNSFPSMLRQAASSAQQIEGGLSQLEKLIQGCTAGSAQSCAAAQQAASQLSSGMKQFSGQLASGADTADQGIQQLSQFDTLKGSVAQLAAGAQRVSSGVEQVATGIERNLLGSNAEQLKEGASQVANGSQQLSEGLSTLSSRSSDLTQGASQVARGSQSLATGAHSAADGADQLSSASVRLNDGARQLSEGSSSLLSGTEKLSGGLSDISGQLPTVEDNAVSSRAQALAQPVTLSATADEDVSTDSSMAAAAAIVALWLGSLMSVVALGKMRGSRLEEAATAMRLARESIVPSLLMSSGQVLVIAVVMKIADVDVHRPLPAFLIMLIAALAFTVINDAFMAIFGRKGGLVASMTLFVVQFVALGLLVPISTQGSFVSWIHASTPLPQVATALQSAITGGSTGVGMMLGKLAVWVVVSFVLAIVGVRRRRATSVRAIRHRAAAV